MFKVVDIGKGNRGPAKTKLTLKPIGPVLSGAKLERNATGEINSKKS